MQIAYWITAGVLAIAYLVVGGLKLSRSPSELAAKGMGWALDFGTVRVKLIGALEVLGAVGVVLPLLLHLAQPLAPAAAIGLAVVQIVAITVTCVAARRGPSRPTSSS